MKSNAKCVLSVDKDVVTLTLKETELNDAGTYKCEASNKLGKVNTECTIEVQGTFVYLPRDAPAFKDILLWTKLISDTSGQLMGTAFLAAFELLILLITCYYTVLFAWQ